jgi:hypothetical protein
MIPRLPWRVIRCRHETGKMSAEARSDEPEHRKVTSRPARRRESRAWQGRVREPARSEPVYEVVSGPQASRATGTKESTKGSQGVRHANRGSRYRQSHAGSDRLAGGARRALGHVRTDSRRLGGLARRGRTAEPAACFSRQRPRGRRVGAGRAGAGADGGLRIGICVVGAASAGLAGASPEPRSGAGVGAQPRPPGQNRPAGCRTLGALRGQRAACSLGLAAAGQRGERARSIAAAA